MSHIGQKCDRLTQFFSTCEENKTLAKQDRVKRSPFYVEGDKLFKKEKLAGLEKIVKNRPQMLWFKSGKHVNSNCI